MSIATPKAQTSTPTHHPKLRKDIQGLRALAVLLVVADHILSFPSGGFVGVDVFFVISGFLITGLLVRQHTRYGCISFKDFYRRRARRILPLVGLVLMTTLTASWWLSTAGRFKDVLNDGAWSLAFAANWHFAAAGADYMNANGPVSPLQHFWSLAVEEQFYLAWPWVVVLVVSVIAGRAHLSPRASAATLGAFTSVLILASFGFSVWETASAPTIAYFSTFSRAWELGIGALLAVVSGSLSRIPDKIRPLLAYAGLAGILWSVFNISTTTAFPGPGALIPVVSAATVIAAGTGGRHLFIWPITNRVSVYVGDISYSLYLWHFPLIILGTPLLPFGHRTNIVITLALIGAISAASFHLIEDPVRNSNWLGPRASKPERRLVDRRVGKRRIMAGTAGLATATVVVMGMAVAGGYSFGTATVPDSRMIAGSTPSGTAGSPSDALAMDIQASLAATNWPPLDPSIDSLGPDSKASEWINDGCLSGERGSRPDPIRNSERCVYGPANSRKTAVVLGDSIAISYVPGIRAALEPRGYKILVYTMQQCPAISVIVLKSDRSQHPQCATFRNWALARVREVHPDIVLMSTYPGLLSQLASGATSDDAISEWRAGSVATFTSLQGSANRVVILDPPPGGKNLQVCATRMSVPSSCVSTPNARYAALAIAGRSAASEVAAMVKIEFIQTREWFCFADSCPSFIGTHIVYADDTHLTPAFSTALGGTILAALGRV